VAAIRNRDLAGFIWLTSAAREHLAPLATELGLTLAGLTSLMSYVASDLPASAGRYSVGVVKDQVGIDAFTSLTARGFELPLETWRRLMTLESLHDPAITHVVASLNEEPISAGTTITTGSSIGIWNMATPPEHQRKGAGRAVLTELLRLQMVDGRGDFYLIASDAGKHLYEQVGFRTVDEATLWLIGA
jgi:GNAT superfamily N-acetyltransferase